MSQYFIPSLTANTPSIAVHDNRGLAIRTLAYNRRSHDETVDELSSRNRYNASGQLIASRDPRLEVDNFRYQYSLSGVPLRTDSVDSGSTLQLADSAGRTVLTLDAHHTRRWVEYETGEHSLDRPLSYREQAKGGLKTVTDRFFYGENSEQDKGCNLNGTCVRHYDSAGLQALISQSIIGIPLQQQRRLLTDTKGPVDWFGEKENWGTRLSESPFVSHSTTNALGQLITQTDAKGHIQRMAYNRAGQLIGSWLTVKNGVEQPIVYSLTYSAAGQKLREESGNGVITEYRYEPQTQRLIAIKTTRPAKKDRPTLLQDLRYDYDPVGNILAIHNDAEATRFYRNQKIVPETTYRYDALYQLIEATGREADTNGIQNSQLPTLASLNDSNQFVNYTRRYHYDRAGNLLKIQHTGASQYSTHITVSDSSNHGIQQQDGITARDIRSQFDAAGNQRQLQPGQPLRWNSRNQLQQVEPVPRNDGISDSESYLYDGSGSRVVKISLHKTHNAIQTRSVIYLAGLELRSQYNGNNLTEDFQVMTVGAAGRAQVRVLHWERGQPADIVNDQLRYSFDNHIGSALIELDSDGDIISQEEYYPFGGTAVLASRNTMEAKYKTVRYSGKERDTTGLYYYGYRYYQPWLGRWLSADPAGTIDGLNLYRMVRNNPIKLVDRDGLQPDKIIGLENYAEYLEETIEDESEFLEIAQGIGAAFLDASLILPEAIARLRDESLADENEILIRKFLPDQEVDFSRIKDELLDRFDNMEDMINEVIENRNTKIIFDLKSNTNSIAYVNYKDELHRINVTNLFIKNVGTVSNIHAILHELSHMELPTRRVTKDYYYISEFSTEEIFPDTEDFLSIAQESFENYHIIMRTALDKNMDESPSSMLTRELYDTSDDISIALENADHIAILALALGRSEIQHSQYAL
ncbi:putative insecticidal toxin complex protein [Yersinia pseudotuberculosis IP 31758]|uniref:Putative insecticidal toxin complex protein n=3 Tax=Yersinia pseudotuberculosis TaxID=633 RepID=A0A0U1QZN1_YERP3|nr:MULTISPECIES: RHS repeat domain-containing protein [Yersinia pseudotuberculosis complex]ABS48272.1 putative insecticidal toxin complex protein [Yersinia pseudotuberculosis IP 31758]AJK15102.1 RHS repeat-associated core domain protein [Yersinia pseudotuberculosis str. PA3606]